MRVVPLIISHKIMSYSIIFPVVIMESPRPSQFSYLPFLFPALPVIHRVFIFTILSSRIRDTSFVWCSVNQPLKLRHWP